MGAAEEDQRQSGAEFLPGGQGLHRRLRVRVDLEVVDSTECRAQLVLDPALDTEDVDLEPMGGVGESRRDGCSERTAANPPSMATAIAADVPVPQPAGTAERTLTSRVRPRGWERVDGGL